MSPFTPLLGAHMSIAGGYYKAVDAAAEFGMTTVQIFTKNNNQWNAKPLTDEDVRLFRNSLKNTGITSPVAHDSYLINLASPDDALWQKSVDAFVIELERAEALDLIGVVMHPGSHLTLTVDEGLQRVIKGLDEAHKRTKGFKTQTLIETTAGQGTNLGHRFEHLATILEGVRDDSRLGLCVDSCHIFAAGYPLHTRAEYDATMDELDRVAGLARVKAFHLNDSLKPLGSRVDRHAHIGQGHIGLEPFGYLLSDARFALIPKYLETAKETDESGEPYDAINMRTLRSLLPQGKAKAKKSRK